MVEEVTGENAVIINFSGDLVRVLNMTNEKVKAGQRVQLFVEDLNPLKLRFEKRKLNLPINSKYLDIQA